MNKTTLDINYYHNMSINSDSKLAFEYHKLLDKLIYSLKDKITCKIELLTFKNCLCNRVIFYKPYADHLKVSFKKENNTQKDNAMKPISEENDQFFVHYDTRSDNELKKNVSMIHQSTRFIIERLKDIIEKLSQNKNLKENEDALQKQMQAVSKATLDIQKYLLRSTWSFEEWHIVKLCCTENSIKEVTQEKIQFIFDIFRNNQNKSQFGDFKDENEILPFLGEDNLNKKSLKEFEKKFYELVIKLILKFPKKDKQKFRDSLNEIEHQITPKNDWFYFQKKIIPLISKIMNFEIVKLSSLTLGAITGVITGLVIQIKAFEILFPHLPKEIVLDRNTKLLDTLPLLSYFLTVIFSLSFGYKISDAFIEKIKKNLTDRGIQLQNELDQALPQWIDTMSQI